MSEHFKLKDLYCRLCCCKIKSKSAEACKFKDRIFDLFSHNVENDPPSTSKKICDGCRRKVVREPGFFRAEPCTIAEFPNHNDESCRICEGKVLPATPFSLVKVNNLKLEHLETVAIKLGFVRIPDPKDNSLLLAVLEMDQVNLTAHVSKVVSISCGLAWTLKINGRSLQKDHEVYKTFQTLSKENMEQFLTYIKECTLCTGNNDFMDIISEKLSSASDFKGNQGDIKAYIENQNFERPLHTQLTIRSADCSIVVHSTSSRCENCSTFRRNSLNKIRFRKEASPEVPSKFKPNIYMSHNELQQKSANLHTENRQLKRKVVNLEKKLERVMESDGMTCQTGDHQFLSAIVLNTEGSPFEEDTPQGLLWEQQKKMASLKCPNSMRWHPLMIRWCLSIYLKSPAAYEHLRSGPFLELPHQNTLQKYISYTDPGTGFNIDVMNRLKHNIKFDSLKPHQKNVSLIWDEIHIKSGLAFSRPTGKLIGYTEMGDINNELKAFERQLEQEEDEDRELATIVLTFMVRGLFTYCNYPIGFFASHNGFDGSQLYPLVWEAVRVCESQGFHVRTFVSDGASPNRKFYKLNRLEDESNMKDGQVYWAWNRFRYGSKIYFICDPPHLIKTIRNNVENSGAHNNTRNLVCNGNRISWHHVENLYTEDLGLDSSAIGLRKLPFLTHEHIYLGPRTRMRVNLAAQVMSKRVVTALRLQDKPETVATRDFFDKVDDFFDCLNVKNTFEWQMKRKENLKPYEHALDPRLKWLTDDFLGMLKDWKKSIDERKDVTEEDKLKLFISKQTMAGITITIHGFVEFVKEILMEDGVNYFLSDKLNQDPIEEHFGRHRGAIGGSDNPTLEQYSMTERKLQVAKDDLIRVLHGNNRGRNDKALKLVPSLEPALPVRKKMKLD